MSALTNALVCTDSESYFRPEQPDIHDSAIFHDLDRIYMGRSGADTGFYKLT